MIKMFKAGGKYETVKTKIKSNKISQTFNIYIYI